MKEQSKLNILFLYTELAGYFVGCLNFLSENYPVSIKLVHWPINDEAPFDFEFHQNIEVINKGNLSDNELLDLTKKIDPKIVFVSGWVDKSYRKIAALERKKGVPVILGNDNPWKGNWRQRIACLISSFYLKPYYSHTWVPGKRQQKFARNLNFPEKNILLGFYSADVELFKKDQNQKRNLSKTILYAGRFLDWKGVNELYQSFLELKNESSNDWKLLMIGRGPLKSLLEPKADIEIQDFIQPSELRKIMQNVGAFCLPSYEEHWGVAVHEAAAAGCPLLVSDGVGAGDAFVKNGFNGFVFTAKNKPALKEALKKFINSSEESREAMSKNSIKMAEKITPELWSTTLMSLSK